MGAGSVNDSNLSIYGGCLSSHHLSLNREGRWGTTDDFATSFLNFSLFSLSLFSRTMEHPTKLISEANQDRCPSLIMYR